MVTLALRLRVKHAGDLPPLVGRDGAVAVAAGPLPPLVGRGLDDLGGGVKDDDVDELVATVATVAVARLASQRGVGWVTKALWTPFWRGAGDDDEDDMVKMADV